MKVKLSIMMFFQFFLWSTWYVSGGTYLIQKLEFSGTQVGLIYGTFAISGLISPFLSGILADRFFSTEKLLAWFHLIGGSLLLGLAFIESFSWFYIVVLLHTFVYIPTTALSSSITFHHIEDRTKDFALIRVWGSVGWVLAGFLVGYLEWETTIFPFILAGISAIALGIFCFFLPKTPPLLSAKRRSLRSLLSSESGKLLLNRAFLVFLIGITLSRIPASFYYSFVNPFLFEIGVPNPAGRMALGQVAEIFLMLSLPFVLSKSGLKPLLVIGLLCWGIRYLLFAYGNADDLVWMVYLGILLHGITYNYTSLVGQIYVDQSVPAELRASAQGFIVFITVGIGPLIGAYLAGSVVEYHTVAPLVHNWTAIFWVPGAVGVLTGIWFFFAFRPKINKEPSAEP
ncbi:MAG: MFS transporter [Bacteroidota bacterium]